MAPSSTLESQLKPLLTDRAEMLAASRAFFAKRGVLEVDVPALTRYASVDQHIDLLPVTVLGSEQWFLHTSPEYGMKRLLAEGSGDIYQLSHVFRDYEIGAQHQIEFTMAEWYRLGFTLDQMIDETVDYVRLFVGDHALCKMSYLEALHTYTTLDTLTPTSVQLVDAMEAADIKVTHEPTLDMAFACLVEPHLTAETIYAIYDFPAEQAALAQVNGETAERFELYYGGFELANGYHELRDPVEQEKRLHVANGKRKANGRPELPLDPTFLAALHKGLPDCCGVAVGFDRLMMARRGVSDIRDVLALGD